MMFTPKVLRRKLSFREPSSSAKTGQKAACQMRPKMGQRMSLFDNSYQIVIIGLDNAGKSTTLYRLKMGHFVHTAPTIGFNCEKVRATDGKAKNSSFTMWDVGGQEKLRPLWRTYIRQTDAVIFVVDSTDADRFDEAKLELSNLLRTPDFPSQVPILVLANKQDLPDSQTEECIQTELGLAESGPSRVVDCRGCCAITGEGLDGVLDVLLDMITKSKKLNKKNR